MTDIIRDLKSKLAEVVGRASYKGLLFSGGIDTSILASLKPEVIGITVSLGDKADDLSYAILVAKYFKMKHLHRKIEIDEAIESIPCVIKILKSFDPALPNDLVVYFGLKFAKQKGFSTVATGDGSDELFGGYSFMKKLNDLEVYIRKISERMSFSSNKIGDFFKIKIIQPFMEKNFIDYALKIPIDLKIRKDKGKIWGKWILRKSFEDILPKKIVWQNKRPLEYGSGMTELRKIISAKITDSEFKEKKKFYPIKFLNKEHLYYYEIYKKEVGEIPKPMGTQKECPGCAAGMEYTSFHCKVCGYVLICEKGGEIR